jgi:predicted acylesterase/phospholipase RssA
MPKRVAITIAGAVSLGSYEAGVLYEVLNAIRVSNEEAGNDEGRKIYIDVITGASAGAMTAAMVAQALMYDGLSLDGEFTNPLYQAWVEQISLMGLVKMKLTEKSSHSLFSSDLIAHIGRKMLIDSMKDAPNTPHSAIELIGKDKIPDVLRLGMAITNLNGIDYMIPIVGIKEGGFNYTSSMDDKRFELAATGIKEIVGLTQVPATWKEMCETAIASGAFPVAFRPAEVDHAVEEYGNRLPNPVTPQDEGKTFVDWDKKWKTPRSFAHSDGGVLQNQPLGIAKDLVNQAVHARAIRNIEGSHPHRDSEDRLYVFVAPHAVKSTAAELTASRISIWEEVKTLFRVYTRQAMFHDWITAEGVNQRIRVLDERAIQLADEIIAGNVTVATLQSAAQQLNMLLMGSNRDASLKRLTDQYRDKYADIVQKCGVDAAKAFIEGIATLESAAQLGDSDKMKIIAVIADAKTELMGGGLSSFVGFFNKKFREHDYWMGRVKARKYLQRSDVMSILGVTAWPAAAQFGNTLPNPSGVKPPVTTWQLVRSGTVPAMIMIIRRPILVLILLAILAILFAAGWALWHLLH